MDGKRLILFGVAALVVATLIGVTIAVGGDSSEPEAVDTSSSTTIGNETTTSTIAVTTSTSSVATSAIPDSTTISTDPVLNALSSCGSSARLTGVLRLGGAISEDIEFNRLLPIDRSPVVITDEVKGEVVGEAAFVDILLVADAGGNADTYEESHTETDPDGVLSGLFRLGECAGTLTYRVEFERR
jgi:hypothetical protein